MKPYWKWTLTTLVGAPTLIFGVGFILAGLQELEQPQPVMQAVALALGITLLIANPILYLLYRKQERKGGDD